MVHKEPSIISPLQAQSIYLPMLEIPIGWDTAAVLAVPSVTGVGAKDKEGKGKRSKHHSRGGRGYVLPGPLTLWGHTLALYALLWFLQSRAEAQRAAMSGC